jgi:hypothetical protein
LRHSLQNFEHNRREFIGWTTIAIKLSQKSARRSIGPKNEKQST